MQIFRLKQDQGHTEKPFSAMVVTRDGPLGGTSRRLSSMGGVLEVVAELYDGLAAFADDHRAADVLVIDCDGYDGLEAVRRAVGRLCPNDLRAPVVLISTDCREQTFPLRRSDPILLRAPLSNVAIRLALETVFKGRFLTAQV